MKLRHAAALAFWGSRLAATVLIAAPVTFAVKGLDSRLLRWMYSDANSFLLYEERVHSQSTQKLFFGFAIFGAAYFCLVELFAWALRKYAKKSAN